MQLDVATAVRDTRRAVGWSQEELARRCGLGQTTISMVERNDGNASLDTIGSVLDALGIRPELRLRPPFIDRRLQADIVHRKCAAYVRAKLEAHNWTVVEEVEIQDGRMHGWIDVLAFEPSSGCVLMGEIKTELHDLGQIERTMGWYERSAWRAASGLGWRPRSVVGILFLLATAAVEKRLAENVHAIKQSYPVRGIKVQAWLDRGSVDTPAGRGLALIDPRRRGRRWAWASMIDGSRAAPPYLDYAAAARALVWRRRTAAGFERWPRAR
jgi:transcriptional regulator with XRE-family HTH domain